LVFAVLVFAVLVFAVLAIDAPRGFCAKDTFAHSAAVDVIVRYCTKIDLAFDEEIRKTKATN